MDRIYYETDEKQAEKILQNAMLLVDEDEDILNKIQEANKPETKRMLITDFSDSDRRLLRIGEAVVSIMEKANCSKRQAKDKWNEKGFGKAFNIEITCTLLD